MAKLIYGAIASLDGYIEDERGTFDTREAHGLSRTDWLMALGFRLTRLSRRTLRRWRQQPDAQTVK